MTEVPLTIKEAAAALRAKHVSSVELTTTMLRRSKALNPELGAFIVITEDSALAAAAAADANFASGVDLGPLQGIPFCTKDNIATLDAPTTANSVVLDPAWGEGGTLLLWLDSGPPARCTWARPCSASSPVACPTLPRRSRFRKTHGT